mgnify:CR=1 FL=1|jgi:hypothetical protein
MKKTLGLICVLTICFMILFDPMVSAQPDGPTLVEVVVCHGIEAREPVGIGSVFSAGDGRIYCFTRIKSTQPAEIKHIWTKNGANVAEVNLKIGVSSSWRTFSSKLIRPVDTGQWTVEVVTADGTHLGSISFRIEK